MKVLGISGSPNPAGNTAYALRHCLGILEAEGARTRYLSLSGRSVSPCLACFACQADGSCVLKDGMEEIYEGLRWCDGLVLASPVYFGLVSGPLKTMMDRCVCFRPEYDKPLALSGKIGCGIACGGFRNGGQETTLQNMHTFLLQQNMMVINDGQGFSHAGAAIVGEARDDELGLRTVRNVAMNLLMALKGL